MNHGATQGPLTRVHVWSEAALSESEVVAIVEKLRPEAFTTVPEAPVSYSRLSPWPEELLAFLAARFHRVGVDLDVREIPSHKITTESGFSHPRSAMGDEPRSPCFPCGFARYRSVTGHPIGSGPGWQQPPGIGRKGCERTGPVFPRA